jgi:hypothetical protein
MRRGPDVGVTEKQANLFERFAPGAVSVSMQSESSTELATHFVSGNRKKQITALVRLVTA